MRTGRFAYFPCVFIALSIANSSLVQAQKYDATVSTQKSLYKDGEPIAFIHTFKGERDAKANVYISGPLNPKGIKTDSTVKYPIAPGLGRKVLPTRDFVFPGESFRSKLDYKIDAVGISAYSNGPVFIERETSLAADSALTIERREIVVGDRIAVKVDLKKIESQIDRFANGIGGYLELVMMPRQVSGGGWLPPVGHGVVELKEGQSEYTLWQPQKNDPDSLNTGLIPTGIYQVYYIWDGVILDQLSRNIVVSAPEPGDHTYIKMTPEIAPETNTALPVYDQLPAIGYRVPDGKQELVRYGHMALYRVGRNESLRLIDEREVLCSSGSCSMDDDPSTRQFGDAGGWFLIKHKLGEQKTYPGTYEVRFYWRRPFRTLVYDDRQYVLERKRFVLSEKAVAKKVFTPGWEERAEVLPPDVFAIQSEKNEALEMGERVELYVENTLAAADLGKDPWEVVSADIWVSVHRKDGYGLSCGFFEEVPFGTPVLLKKSTFTQTRPAGARGLPGNGPGFFLPPPPPVMSTVGQPVIETERPVIRGGFNALYSEKGTRGALALSADRGDRHFNLVAPPAPGAYVVRLYRGKFEETAQHAPNAEMLASYDFVVQSKTFSRAVSFGSSLIDINQDIPVTTSIRYDANVFRNLSLVNLPPRSVVPGGARTFPRWQQTQNLGDGAGGVQMARSVELTASARVRKDIISYHRDATQLYLLNSGIVISESDPVRVTEKEPDGSVSRRYNWPVQLVPDPITYDDLKVPFEEWYLNDDLCRVDIVPEHEIRMVDWIAAADTEKASYAGDEFDLVDGEKDTFPELKDVYRGVPFYVEAVFKAPLDSASYRGRIGKKAKVLFKKLDGNPLVYRSADMYVITDKGLEILQ